jgi:hypothetical protein
MAVDVMVGRESLVLHGVISWFSEEMVHGSL